MFYDSNTALISDVQFKEFHYTVSTIGGLATSILAVVTLAFSLLVYDEWEGSILKSVIGKS